jgi:chlorobactene glucosyltransferase
VRTSAPALFFPRAGARNPPLALLHLLSCLSAASLLALAVRTLLARRAAPLLPEATAASAASGDKESEVTVLLPVRNEEQNVLSCLDGLLAQSARPRVRVIDDGSTDATAALVRGRLPAFPQLTLLAAGPLPEGWRGKVHALEVGAAGVSTPWLLCTDADTRHHPETLARSLAAAAAGGDVDLDRRLDAVSLAGFQEAVGFAENLLTPAVFALLDLLLGDWRAVAGAPAGPAIANGQYILVRREAWERCGGFAPIRVETLDDLALVVRLRAHGYRTGFFRAPDLLSVRMYRGVRETARGWRRNLGGLLGPHPWKAVAVLAGLLLPPLVAGAELATGHPIAAGFLWAAGAAASILWRAGSGHAPVYGLLFPLDALTLAGVLLSGVVDRRRGRLANWKGRVIRF